MFRYRTWQSRPIPNGAAGPSSPFAGVSEAFFFTASGATQPVYGSSTSPSAVYHNGKTYVTWETYDRVADKRWTAIRAYTHSSGTWGRIYNVGPHSEASGGDDDDHGVPSIAVNADGRLIVCWGDHDGSFHLSTSTNVEDESLFTTLTNGMVGAYTYPHLVLSGTTMYCMFRLNVAPGATYADGAKILVARPITWSGATATVAAEIEIANFGNDSRWYQGNAFLSNGRIVQGATRADYGDTFRRDVYYYEIDFGNSRLQAFGGTTVVFPVGRTDMDNTFRLRATSVGQVTQAPHTFLEAAGTRTHMLFPEGVNGGTDQTIYHFIGSSGTFAAVVDTGANVTHEGDSVRIISGANSSMEMWYPRDPSAAARGGNVYKRTLVSGGAANAWGAEQLIISFDATRFRFTQIADVFNADSSMRIIAWEGATDDLDASAFPGKRGYACGDSGTKGQNRSFASDPIAFTAGGHWIEANPDYCYSDTGMTTLSGVNGLVRAIVDRSGNGHHMILEGSEPGTLRLDDGIYWVDVGDEISPTCSYAATAYVLPSSNAYWSTVAARDWQSAAQATDVAIMDDGSGSDRIFRLVRGSNQQPQPIAYSSSGTSVNGGTGTTNSIRHNDDFILGLHVNGVDVIGYWNQVQLGTATLGSNSDPDAARPRIGASATLGSTTYLRGRFYGWIARSGNIDLTTRNADMAYLRSKQPR
jgi:hypothetical protein